MNYLTGTAVFLVICLTVNVSANELLCTAAIATCVASNPSAIAATDCAGKKPLFDCIKSGACTTSMTIYKSTSNTYGYQDCGAGSIAMGFSLPILMFTLAKFFSQ